MKKIEELENYHLYSVNEKKQIIYHYASDDFYKVHAEHIKNICILSKKLYKEKKLDDIWRVMFNDYDYEYINDNEANEQRASFMSLHVYLYKKDREKMNKEDVQYYYMDILNRAKDFYFLGEPLNKYGYRSFLLFDTEKDFYNYNNKFITYVQFFILHKHQIINDDIVIDTCIHNTDIKLKASDLGFNIE